MSAAACDIEAPTQELQHAVTRAAAVWRDCGVLQGESVAIRLIDSIEATIARLGAQAAGAVPVAIDPGLSASHWLRLWSNARWRFILAESRAEQPHEIRDFVLTLAEWREAQSQE
jgi:acyl-CoA synthetase (AMP-forming)/AMP-acid ligase II